MKKLLMSATLALGFALAPQAEAATLITGGGTLFAATDVSVEGEIFDVVVSTSGSCIDLFSGCDDVSDFAFENSDDATTALMAFSSQVLFDSELGNFRSDPSIFGCSPRCTFFTPYGFNTISGQDFILLRGLRIDDPDPDLFHSFGFSVDTRRALDISEIDNIVALQFFAVGDDPTGPTTGVGQVPIPATLPLLLGGLGGLAIFRQRRKTSTEG